MDDIKMDLKKRVGNVENWLRFERVGAAHLVQRLGYELDESEVDTRW
jgi:hypothetical protein